VWAIFVLTNEASQRTEEQGERGKGEGVAKVGRGVGRRGGEGVRGGVGKGNSSGREGRICQRGRSIRRRSKDGNKVLVQARYLLEEANHRKTRDG